jgi:hypothetical protein
MPLIDIVAGVATRALSRNKLRWNFDIKNDSGAAAYWGKTRAVAIAGPNQGYLIAAGGDAVSNEYWKGEVWIISGAGIDLTVDEDVTPPWRVAQDKADRAETGIGGAK